MDLFRLAAFALPLGFDTFAIAIVLGLRGVAPLRPAVVFTLFETAMPLFGIALGRFAGERFATGAQLLGGIVLLAVAFHALREAFDDDDDAAGLAFATLRAACAAGLAISTDELAVGFPIGAVGIALAPMLATIAIQTLLVTLGGIALGRSIGAVVGARASRYAGIGAALAFATLGLVLIGDALRRSGFG